MISPTSGPTRWWQWPTVLSLDAPIVAVAWQWLFGSIAFTPIRWPEATVLALSIWLSYVADRWFEGWRVAPDLIQTARHRFYQRWRWPVATIWVLVLLADLGVAFLRLSHRELLAGAMLVTPTLLYLFSHQLVHRNRRWRAPKEICIAALLAAGASTFVVANSHATRAALIVPVLLFAALCFTNVALIAVWEQEVDETHGQDSLVRRFRFGQAVSRLLPLLLTAVAVAAGAFQHGNGTVAAHCVAASALLLACLDRVEHRLGWQAARVLADLVLLTPLLPLFRS